MKFLIPFLLLLWASSKAELVDSVTEVEPSFVYGLSRITIDKAKPSFRDVDSGEKRIVIYVKNTGDRILRIPTRGFELLKNEKNGLCVINLFFGNAESAASSRRIVVPECDFGITEVHQNETVCLLINYPTDWPMAQTMKVKMDMSENTSRRYRLDYFSSPVLIKQ